MHNPLLPLASVTTNILPSPVSAARAVKAHIAHKIAVFLQVWPESGADAWLRASATEANVPRPVKVKQKRRW